MTYIKQTWIDDDESTPLNAARLNYIEDGLEAVTSGAPLTSPAFTGVPTAPTAAQGTNTTQIATTAMVHSEALLKVDKTSLPYNVKDHGAVGDGVADDTAAIQAAIDVVSVGTGVPSMSIYLPPGTYKITDTINIRRKAVIMRGAGVGNSPQFSANPGNGTRIVWGGSAAIPMFHIWDVRNMLFEDFCIVGHNTNVPSEGIYFESVTGDAGGYNGQLGLSRIRFGYGAGENATNYRMTYHVRFGGLNGNNDQFRFVDCEFKQPVTACVKFDNTQSIWGYFLNPFFEGNFTAKGVVTSSGTTLINATHDANLIDYEINSSAAVVVHGYYSERAVKNVHMTSYGSRFAAYGGLVSMQYASVTQGGDGHFFQADSLQADGAITLDGVKWYHQSGTRPNMQVRGPSIGAVTGGHVAIKNCNLLKTDLDLTCVNDRGIFVSWDDDHIFNREEVISGTTWSQKDNLPRDGRVIHQGAKNLSGVIATLDAAEAVGPGTIAYFPAGVYNIGNGLSLSGYSCQIRGAGAALPASGVPAGTVFYASTQTGPVMDFTGWVAPEEFKGKVTHKEFYLRGSGVADATKVNTGLQIDFIMSVTFSDIVIADTGGPCLNLTATTPGTACYLSDFERFTLSMPVSAKLNDVPYFQSVEANGNRFSRFGFISRAASADTGVSGAVVLGSSATYASSYNLLDTFWFENLHIPTNGTLISHSGAKNTLSNFQFFDCKRESGATNTTHYRILPTLVNNYGGNTISGIIPGDNAGGATDPHYGVDIQQSYNSVVGIKGYRGNNVILASGVGRTFIHLAGSHSGASTLGWTDNSGLTTNHLIDEYNQVEVRPAGWTLNGSTVAPTPNVQVFTSSGTWTKPANVTTVRVWAIGAGNGGGSGRRGAAGTIRGGGGGGGGGGRSHAEFQASSLTSTVAVTVGTGGAGGAAITVDDTNGNDGAKASATTSFGAYLRAPRTGANNTNGGTTTGGIAGPANQGTWMGNLGGAGSSTGLLGGPGLGGLAAAGAPGGGAGGGITSANAVSNGGNGGAPTDFTSGAGTTGGVAPGGNGNNGASYTTNEAGTGEGGSGGASSITGVAGNGGNGGLYGAGGGGGGASLNGNNSGAGGNGADGIVIVVSA